MSHWSLKSSGRHFAINALYELIMERWCDEGGFGIWELGGGWHRMAINAAATMWRTEKTCDFRRPSCWLDRLCWRRTSLSWERFLFCILSSLSVFSLLNIRVLFAHFGSLWRFGNSQCYCPPYLLLPVVFKDCLLL